LIHLSPLHLEYPFSIQFAGYITDVEIPMIFVGVRPAVKPYEELVREDERLEPSGLK
jgi:FlaA1/EpsC-like NDP-sugar epimerase